MARQRLDALLEAITRLERAALRDRKPRALAPAQRELVTEMAALWQRQASLFVQRLAGQRHLFEALREEDWAPDWDAAVRATRAELLALLRRALQAALAAGAQAAEDDLSGDAPAELGITFDATHPAAIAYLDKRLQDLPDELNGTSRQRIAAIIRDAAEAGLSYDVTARQIAAEFADYGQPAPQEHLRTRAELVAATELGNAYVAANAGIARDLAASGLTMEKAWLTAEDARVDDECFANEEAGWIALDDDFPDGNSQPLAHPGCRCDLLTRVKPDKE